MCACVVLVSVSRYGNSFLSAAAVGSCLDLSRWLSLRSAAAQYGSYATAVFSRDADCHWLFVHVSVPAQGTTVMGTDESPHDTG